MKLEWKLDRLGLWQQLTEQQLVSGDLPAPGELESPWYVRVMIGFAGWLAAIFMLGFIAAALEFVFRNEGVAIIIGAVMLVLAFLILDKKGKQDFAGQFGLAMSFAGQALIAYGLFDIGNLFNSWVWLMLALLQTALAWLMPNSIHRVWSAFAAAMALSYALTHAHIYYLQSGLLMGLVAYVWLHELRWLEQQQRVKPIGYGLTLALVYQATSRSMYHVFYSFSSPAATHKVGALQPWMGELLAGMVIVYVVWALLRQQQVQVPGRVANATLLATVLVVLASIEANGISVGVMIILLGFANGNRILTGIGITALLYYLSVYYFLMHTTLLEKSKLLFLLGSLLLLTAWVMRRWLFKPQEVQHAA